MPYTQILYHIVFSTKKRERTLKFENQEELFKYIWGTIKNKKSHLYRINGFEDHLHILSSLHPTICLSNFIKDIKVSSSIWIKKNNIFPFFESWQEGYAAFTCSYEDKENLIKYIMSQKEHHRNVSFREELINLYKDAGIEYNEKYLF
ncbi:MAG: IS200/IS605 family transposase [Candidatus Cloacimonetes bacterium]|nr:IS200/IS605 family transposase [Candidatus Cloacimonadota bacterium]